jgi:hypothetical protein
MLGEQKAFSECQRLGDHLRIAFGYEVVTAEVLAGILARPDAWAGSRPMLESPVKALNLTGTNMNHVTNHSERPRRNITWQAQPPPAHCAHEFEVISHELGAALKRCVKCGSLEAE